MALNSPSSLVVTESTQIHNSTFQYESLESCHYQSCFNLFSSETGIYSSKHKYVELPSNPFLDIVSFIFSHKHDGVTAFIDSSSGFSLSFTELQQMVKSMSSGLHEIGISKGDVVLIMLPNTIYYSIVFLGVLSVGAIATTINPLCSLAEIKKRMNDCNVTLVFTIFNKVREIAKMGCRVFVVPESGESGSSCFRGFSHINKLLSSNPETAPKPIINQQETAAILYSSGTTGVSKGVAITHENFIAMVELFVRFEASQYEQLGSENVYLATVPMFHIYGLSLFVIGLLSLGSTVVVMKKFNVDEMVRAINRYSVTHLPVVPPILISLIRAKAVGGGCDLRSLKQVSCGASPLSKNIIQDFLHIFPHVDFIQGYGLTESTAVGTRGFNTEKIKKYASVGLLAPNMQAKVVNLDTGSCLPPGRRGELWLRGPGIMKGYINNVDATSTVDKDGWLHTGDIVYFDQDGYLYILDRMKEIIKYKGFQIAPADLESVLISHPDILDAAVTAATDEEAGEVPVAFVVKREGSDLSQVDVINFVSGQVAPYEKVRKVVFTSCIPKSAAGKILRRELKSLLTSRI